LDQPVTKSHRATFDAGTSVSLFVVVTPAYSSRVIFFNTVCCDVILASDTCRIEMNADRSVTIGAGVD
jgi:hypothetical protein